MALYSVDNVGTWTGGGFTGALVIAANAKEALDLVADGPAKGIDRVQLKVTREKLTGKRILWSGFDD